MIISTTLALVMFATGSENYPATFYEMSGEVVSVRGDALESRKTFVCRFVPTGEADSQYWWWLEQEGHGNWAWPDRFGRFRLGDEGVTTGAGPQLVYDHDSGYTLLPLPPPLWMNANKLKMNSQGNFAKLQFQVSKVDKQDADTRLHLTIRDRLGECGTVTVARDNGVISKWQQNVFVGNGDEHRMTFTGRLINIPTEKLTKSQQALSALSKVREGLELTPQQRNPTWSQTRLAVMRESLPKIIELAEGSAVESLVQESAQSAKLQKAVAGAVAELQKQAIGKTISKFELDPAALGKKGITNEDLKGQVTVLHFWTYQDQPLIEPYGQIGYVDFFYRKRSGAGVNVYGVGIDDRFAQVETRPDAIRSVRRLRSFMNLSYPVLIDGSELLRQIGDPRNVGGELPLTVVVGPQGKIVHYHAGVYEVDRSKGLADLDGLVESLLSQPLQTK